MPVRLLASWNGEAAIMEERTVFFGVGDHVFSFGAFAEADFPGFEAADVDRLLVSAVMVVCPLILHDFEDVCGSFDDSGNTADVFVLLVRPHLAVLVSDAVF